MQRITFLTETILRKRETINFHDHHLYFVVVGKLALGKRIVIEQEFIYGKSGRSAIALRTTSLVRLVLDKQRY